MNNVEENAIAPPIIEEPPQTDALNSSKRRRKSMMPKRGMNEKSKDTQGRELLKIREERQLSIDDRHRYVFRRLALAEALSEETVEQQLIADNKFDEILQYFKSTDKKVLMFFYQPPIEKNEDGNITISPANKSKTRFFLTNGKEDAFVGNCYFFIRQTEKPISTTNVAMELCFMMLPMENQQILTAVHNITRLFVVPMLQKNENWGEIKSSKEASVLKFIKNMENFSNELENASKQLKYRSAFKKHVSLDPVLNELPPSRFQNMVANKEFITELETLATSWFQHVEQILAETEQIRREADDVGPIAELTYWKQRTIKFNQLIDQIKTKRVQTAIGILNQAKSRTLIEWRKLDCRITELSNESSDNIRYLQTLEKYFGEFHCNTPAELMSNIAGIMNAVRMIHSVSSYYNTSQRMSSLFIKVTNQNIKICQRYIRNGESRIWDIEKPVLLERFDECGKLFTVYQKSFKDTQKKVEENPDQANWDFSENYIFGKFFVFIERLDKIKKSIKMIDNMSAAININIEGIDPLQNKFRSICETFKKKNYDILNHRKPDFDNDFRELNNQMKSLEKSLQNFTDNWFNKPLTTLQTFTFIERFRSLEKIGISFSGRYKKMMVLYRKELENVKRIYDTTKNNPFIERNFPPIAGRIAWSRQLYQRIDLPMKQFIASDEKFYEKVENGKEIVRLFNMIGRALVEYEMKYYNCWKDSVDDEMTTLYSTILLYNNDLDEYLVNFDKNIWQLILEAKFMKRFQLEVPKKVEDICTREPMLRSYYDGLTIILHKFAKCKKKVRQKCGNLFQSKINTIHLILQEGIGMLTWNSPAIPLFLQEAENELNKFDEFQNRFHNLLEHRIEMLLDDIATENLCYFPEDELLKNSKLRRVVHETTTVDPLTLGQWQNSTCRHVDKSSEKISHLSITVEKAFYELLLELEMSEKEPDENIIKCLRALICSAIAKTESIDIPIKKLNYQIAGANKQKKQLSESEISLNETDIASIKDEELLKNVDIDTKKLAIGDYLEDNQKIPLLDVIKYFQCDMSQSKKGVRCKECKRCSFFDFLSNGTNRLTESLISCIKTSLEVMKKRLQKAEFYMMRKPVKPEEKSNPPIIFGSIQLKNNMVSFSPTLDEFQHGIIKIAQEMTYVVNDITEWRHFVMLKELVITEMERDALDKGEDPKLIISGSNLPRSLQRTVVDHKDVQRPLIPLNNILNNFRSDFEQLQQQFDSFSFLWLSNQSEIISEMEKEKAIIGDYEAKLIELREKKEEAELINDSFEIGAMQLQTSTFKNTIQQLLKVWENNYGKHLNERGGRDMDEIFELSDNFLKRLQRPCDDLEDVRLHMNVLKEIRESEIWVTHMMIPIEEIYSLLARYELTYNDGNAEKVDTMSYQWRKVVEKAREVNDHLLSVQIPYKEKLLISVEEFKEEVHNFSQDYDKHGPQEDNINPREASDRLTVFQSRFEDVFRKFETYSSGEDLFGLGKTDYPNIQRIKKEITILQKLYVLYNQVNDRIDSYYEIPWHQVDIEKIDGELVDFQNKCRRLPKALKEYQAFNDLKQKIDDFNETCPLLEAIANKSVLLRHWDRISALTGTTFEIDNDNFLLRDVMAAPLLKYKEEIEDICISAVKEKDIEAKLKQVQASWTNQEFQFSTFKSRGELLLKREIVVELISLAEDSLMVLGSLLSNRYNAPFKKSIQDWMHKLTTSVEIIDNWTAVQSLWINLEAVFVGGDIAKQLPQEAKRFSNIDKSWQKVMTKAHETTNVIICCTTDETLGQLLPHLLEQLEICQKSLTGYLEKKRLLFPRFFFVSDPALLEILGQASDSHTIQAHLLNVFDNTKNVRFDDKYYDKIVEIISSEGESVTLTDPVMAQGNVELWLQELLSSSRQSLHKLIKDAWNFIHEETENFNLLDFENSFPAQVGLLGLQFIWTRDAEIGIQMSRQDKKIMNQTAQHFTDILNMLINVTTQELTKMDRTKFETLITIHVHQKDIFDDLNRLHVRHVGDFEWLKQCRFYFVEDMDQCRIAITNVDFSYQNEFLGCTDRLVITPLTDRCYITLAQALDMSMGGAPAGPAGTGKTETTKDMSRCLGKYVVVFNCSDQMDYRGLGRIYKGLAQSGAWGCFDEFNRIDLPVLSVAAQQIAIVLTCKKEKKRQFVFTDGDIVECDREFGLFLTMNPGYAGRQELPENLKIQFRTVAMMVPDRQIIMRVKLASCGFQQNVRLSKKFYTLYKLCEEQLTKQVHYDFGLRNILSVLRTLGQFKRQNPTNSEETIVMRVLRDMNLSKLIDEDEPLFLSLIEDLFPGMVLGKEGYPQMESAIHSQTEQQELIAHEPWILKLIQLYETQRVRHGMMTLGPSGSGKTCCIHTLMKALTETGEPHRELRMNPKAITAPQMFGRLDVATNDWTDGIFSTLWRRTLKIKKGDHVWLVLDGPVDAIWIENLNSVLDDNKMLTLANGDRIPMAPTCKIIFEVHNIDNASPATVSRNGMVFMSSSILDYQPIIAGWLQKKPSSYNDVVTHMFDQNFMKSYSYLTQSLFMKMDLLQCNYVQQSINLLEGLLNDEEEYTKQHLTNIVTYSFIWSLGALLELDDRAKLQAFFINDTSLSLPTISGDQTIYEFFVDENGEWLHWDERLPEYVYPKHEIPDYLGILVPNIDNVCIDYLLNTIAKQNKAVLLIGEQGSAKTVVIKGYCGKYNPDRHVFKSFNFSSATTPNMFQRTIESYVDKRVGTTFGPPAGKKLTVFVDDINMPIINEWGDQITNEITRQMMGMNGFYNLDKPGEFTTIVDSQLIGAMIHPGGGRNDIPQRLKRQFNVFNCTLPSNVSIDKIFSTIGLGYFCEDRDFHVDMIKLIPKIIVATRILWQRVKIKMLPTPAKFHYVFNLRDLSRIWQGILKIEASVCDVEGVTLLSLWKHECQRVIADRFVSNEDTIWFEKTMTNVMEEHFDIEELKNLPNEAYFVDFLRDAPEPTGEEEEDMDLDAPKIYESSSAIEPIHHRLKHFQEQYNEVVRGGKLDLVFFNDAVVHLVKISRILNTPKGHALLVGVGGSGKQSLTKLASFIAGYKIFQITLTRVYNISNLMEDLKFLYKVSGEEGKGITFIFTDNEIKDESFLEYMNNILASGEVSNLFARDEIDEIIGNLAIPMKKEFPKIPQTNENIYEYFLKRVLKNLHVVLCFSPVGEKFRSRALKFPALFSGCTMDWFSRWPKDALVAVSRHFIGNFDVKCTLSVKQQVMEAMGEFQDMVAERCITYFNRFRRQTHVTPKSYLSFISGYIGIYEKKIAEIQALARRMNVGLEKLVEAGKSVEILQKELEVKEKELVVANEKAEKVLGIVSAKQNAAEKVKKQVFAVKEKAENIVALISKDRVIAEEKLEAAKPALEQAENALKTVKAADIATVKKLGTPPHLIMRIMDVVSILCRSKLVPVTQDPERACPTPSWSDAQRLMASNFLNRLLLFPKDTINDEMVELILPYFDMEDYKLEMATKVCGNVSGLLSWTQAMVNFYKVNKDVLPLKANLAEQEVRYKAAMEDLDDAEQQLAAKEAELQEVQAEYDKAMGDKKFLEDDANACKRKMENANILINGLAGEKIRWTEASKTFQTQIDHLVGDVLLATAFLSYCGPFNQQFRTELIKQWRKELMIRKIPVSDEMELTKFLVDSATIAEWNLEGLPNDELSIQNGLIVTSATRYPLLIDPQGQGKVWIKNREGKNELQLTSLDHKYFRTHLEDCLSLGRPLLIEDIGETLDPALDNILEKNFIKSGSSFKVKLGDKEIDVMKDFRLYITTKLGNPSYTPEVSARTAIIDFTVTMKGLEDQLLGLVILKEKAELESERTSLIEEVTLNKRKMKELEDNLLERLTSTEGSLVEDENLISVLQNTKKTSVEVNDKLRIASDTEMKITTAREEFRPVAIRGSILYFLIVEMSTVNLMYQTSLKQFLQLFNSSMENSAKSPVTSKRIDIVIDFLTYEVFRYTVRGLFEQHKFLFALLLTFKIDMNRGSIRFEEFQTLIKGGAALDLNNVEPKPKKWITDVSWLNLVALSSLNQFTTITQQISTNDKQWKQWFDSEKPEEEIIPDGYASFDVFRKLLIVRSMCPDRVAPMARQYIAESMGMRYAESVILNLEGMWKESDNRTPLTCFLSMGSDPTDNINSLAKRHNIHCGAISMGQGQEVHARRLLQSSMNEGKWILLQNCHLGLSFMEELLGTIVGGDDKMDEQFRCWITTEEHPNFSINLLQSSIKYTNEPPQGLKSGLKRTYAGIPQEVFDLITMSQWRIMLYALAFLHTTVQERRKFGPLGWNIPYEFNQADFTSTMQFIQIHLDDLDPKRGISWQTVRYMIGEVHYGGRVTDDYDKILLNTYAKVWFGEHMMQEQFSFSKGYPIPKCKTLQEFQTAIANMTNVDNPECYGLHHNADITYQTKTANEILSTILSIQPKDSASGTGETREDIVYRLAEDMLSKLPTDYILHEVKEALDAMGKLQPLNIFLKQEIDRMQKVITIVRNTLTDLKLAIDGTIIMNSGLKDALDNLYDAMVPNVWNRISWESTTIGFWFTELLDRNQQLRNWIFKSKPNSFWMTGFFNPQGFLTAMRQQITRNHKGWSLDAVILQNEMTKMFQEDVHRSPEEGVYIHGLFLDGAGWDKRNSKLAEPVSKVLFTALPVVHVYAEPLENTKINKQQMFYECPVYKKPRRTDLTYIFALNLRTVKDPSHWVQRGVALLCDIK